jgi:hypothetical protein
MAASIYDCVSFFVTTWTIESGLLVTARQVYSTGYGHRTLPCCKLKKRKEKLVLYKFKKEKNGTTSRVVKRGS